MDKEAKERKLTEAERARLDEFNAICADLESQGYKRTNLVISIEQANILTFVFLILLAAVFLPLFHMLHPDADLFFRGGDSLIFIVGLIVLTVAHELIHGLTWSRFSPNGFKDIDFGVMWNTLSPYCTCKTPLRNDAYILGALAPLVILGIIPLVLALITGSTLLLYIGIVMIVGATGDLMIVKAFLGHKQTSDDVLLYDHPTEAGSVIFER